MLLPNDDGLLECQSDCEFKTSDIFELIEHTGTEFEWSVKVSSNYSIKLYNFLRNLNSVLNAGDLDEAYDMVQDMSLLLSNASAGDFEDFVDECYVRMNFDEGLNDIERMLQENG
jgi:hypothetical protein